MADESVAERRVAEDDWELLAGGFDVRVRGFEYGGFDQRGWDVKGAGIRVDG